MFSRQQKVNAVLDRVKKEKVESTLSMLGLRKRFKRNQQLKIHIENGDDTEPYNKRSYSYRSKDIKDKDDENMIRIPSIVINPDNEIFDEEEGFSRNARTSSPDQSSNHRSVL